VKQESPKPDPFQKKDLVTDEKGERQDHGKLFRKDGLSQDFFSALIDTVKKDNHSIAGILRGCKLVDIGEDVVRFETAFKFHSDKLNEPKIRDILDKRTSEILKKKVRVVVDIKAK
jgi:hypothetical protein